jgi:hypothetical protein
MNLVPGATAQSCAVAHLWASAPSGTSLPCLASPSI